MHLRMRCGFDRQRKPRRATERRTTRIHPRKCQNEVPPSACQRLAAALRQNRLRLLTAIRGVDYGASKLLMTAGS
jgi:hypothetical protein